MVPGFGVSAECQSIGTIGKKQRAVAEVEGLLFSPKNSQLVHILSFCSEGAVSLSIFPTGTIALVVFGPSAKAQEPVARSRGLVIQPRKLSVGAYFELSFLGCGFLIQLSNRSDSPRFRAPWKKIRQKYRTRQEPSLFKGHPLSCQYGDTLCSMIPT